VIDANPEPLMFSLLFFCRDKWH